jgi:tRNA-dihydrouridine synthase A
MTVVTNNREPQLSVAPMLDWTDRHYRHFVRLIAPKSRLYSEMIVAEAILRGSPERLLGYSPVEHPLALQLGGNDPGRLAQAARIGEDFGYDEINLNVGCPSERVQNATFGACLMAAPQRVAEAVAAMQAAVRVPVTVKCRIGIDDQDQYEFLLHFIDTVAAGGCTQFIVHARKAILTGLTPRQNRDIPPLRYDVVYRLKSERPHLNIVINGGIRTVDEAETHCRQVDGVMIGREAYHNPYILAELEAALFGTDLSAVPPPATVVEAIRGYVETELAAGARLHSMSRHLLGLYAHRPGARSFRRVLSEFATRPGVGFEVLEAAVRAAEGAGGSLSATEI